MILKEIILIFQPPMRFLSGEEMIYKAWCAQYLQYLLECSIEEGCLPEWLANKQKLWTYFEEFGFFKGWQVVLKAKAILFGVRGMVLETEYGEMPVKKEFEEKAKNLKVKLINLDGHRIAVPKVARPK